MGQYSFCFVIVFNDCLEFYSKKKEHWELTPWLHRSRSSEEEKKEGGGGGQGIKDVAGTNSILHGLRDVSSPQRSFLHLVEL